MDTKQEETQSDVGNTGIRVRSATAHKLKILASIENVTMIDIVSDLVDAAFEARMKELAADPSAFVR